MDDHLKVKVLQALQAVAEVAYKQESIGHMRAAAIAALLFGYAPRATSDWSGTLYSCSIGKTAWWVRQAASFAKLPSPALS